MLDQTTMIDLSDFSADLTITAGTVDDIVTLSPPFHTPDFVVGGADCGIDWNIGANIVASKDLHAGTLRLDGENADIEINGVRLSERLDAIEQRLNMLRPNAELEQQWDQLRSLGQQYRDLEQDLLQKQKAWDTLQSMPPPPQP